MIVRKLLFVCAFLYFFFPNAALSAVNPVASTGYHWQYLYTATTSAEAKALCNETAASWGYPDACGGGATEAGEHWGVAGYMIYPLGSTAGVDGEFRSITVRVERPSDLGECGIGNPILPSSGTKVETEVDYRYGSGDLPLEVSRTFSSKSPNDGLDYLWRWHFGHRVRIDPLQGQGRAVVYYPDRRSVHFKEQGDGSWVQSANNGLRLERDGRDWLVSGFETNRVERFSEDGDILNVTQDGQKLLYSYGRSTADDLPNVIISDTFGNTLEVVLNESGQPLRIIKPDNTQVNYAYNEDSSLTHVYYSDGTPATLNDNPVRQYHYESTTYPSWTSKYLLTGISDERGIRYVTWSYVDGQGSSGFRAVSSEYDGGVDRYEVTRDSHGRVTLKNPLGKESILYYKNINGALKVENITGVASPNCVGTTQSREYDSYGHVSKTIDRRGHVTDITNNDRGLATQTTYAQGTNEERVVTTQWHSDYRIPEVVTEPGRQTVYTYSPYDNPNYTQRTVTDLTTGESRTWSYTYNQYGQVLTVDGPRTDVTDLTTYTYYSCNTGAECGQIHTITNGLNQVTTYNRYDAHGYPTNITDANGVETVIAYDQRQRMTRVTTDNQPTVIAYDPTGKIKRVTLPDNTYTEYVRDDANRLVAVFDGQGNRIDWTLDNAGNRTDEKVKDPGGTIRKSLENKYDELSRVREMVYAHGGVTGYEYDNNGNRTKVTDASNRVSTSEYDALDRLVKEIDALSGETVYTYDDRDNLTSVTDPEGLTTRYTYNGFDDVVTQTSPDSGLTSFTHDESGNVATETDARGITATYQYDALNRLTSISYPDSSEDISYQYDQGANGIGRLGSITDASGTTTFGYDARGNVTEITQTIAGQSYTQSYRYNGANRLTGMTYPSGRSISYIHDASGRVSEVNSLGEEGAETLASAITRLPFGPMSTLTLGNGVDRSRAYDQDYRVTNLTDGSVFIKGIGYSAVNNITAITDSVDSDLTQLFTYDNLDRLDFAAGNYGEDTYTYDGIGNRETFTRDGQTDSYGYGAGSHRLDSVNGQSYQYDAVGNTLNNGALAFVYNHRNRLSSATSNGVSTDYDHNALGQRVVKETGGTQTHYLYDLAGRLIGEADGSSGEIAVEYAYLDGEPLVMWRAAAENPELATRATIDDAIRRFSSIYRGSPGNGLAQSEINSPTSWSAASNDTDQWIELPIPGNVRVVGIQTQGRGNGNQWVSAYRVSARLIDGSYIALDGGSALEGNTDRNSLVEHRLTVPDNAIAIRVQPSSWYGHISMRVGLVVESLDLEKRSYNLADTERKFSSIYADSAPGTGYGRSALNSAQAWSARIDDPAPWVELALPTYESVVGVQTQGRANSNQWVTAFAVYARMSDGSLLPLTSAQTGSEQFAGNTDRNTIVTQAMTVPQDAVAIRIEPQSWHRHASMRVGLLSVRPIRMATIGESVRRYSSVYRQSSPGSGYARSELNSAQAWSAERNNADQWIELPVPGGTQAVGIRTQGRANSNQWVSGYRVSATLADRRQVYVDNGRALNGNNDRNSVVEHRLEIPLDAVSIRIEPTTWHGHISLRAGLLVQSQGVHPGLHNPPDEQRVFSNIYRDSPPGTGYARSMLESVQGWSAKTRDTEQWIELPIAEGQAVIGVLTQGRGNSNQWVTHYHAYAQLADGRQQRLSASPQGGNSDRDTIVEQRLIVPQEAVAIRINPQGWHSHASMRAALRVVAGGQLRSERADIDDRIRRYSSIYRGSPGEQLGRSELNSAESWSAASNDTNQWIELPIAGNVRVVGLQTQGRANSNQWVTAYRVSARLNNGSYVALDSGEALAGNTDRNSLAEHRLNVPDNAIAIRVQPTAWRGHISMRVGLQVVSMGLDTHSANPSDESRSFSSIYADSAPGTGYGQSTLHSPQGWSSKTRDTSQWLELPIAQDQAVVGLLTQGRANSNQWVTSYDVYGRYADGSEQMLAEALPGNTDRDSVVEHRLVVPQDAVAIRINPQSWYGHPSMRAALQVVPSGVPLLNNGGFESSLTGWNSCSDDGATEVVTDASAGGSALQLSGGDCLYQEFAVTQGSRYRVLCQAKGEQTAYTSLTLTVMDGSYSSLVSEEVEVTSTSYQEYTATVEAPSGGEIGALTFYSGDVGLFDACSVVEE